MLKMRAKMVVKNFTKCGDGETLELGAVCKNEAYPDDGTDEDNTFARWTPSADINMHITNPDLVGKFLIGQKFYVDFSEI